MTDYQIYITLLRLPIGARVSIQDVLIALRDRVAVDWAQSPQAVQDAGEMEALLGNQARARMAR